MGRRLWPVRPLILVLALALGGTGQSRAQSVDPRERQARADFAAGDYQRALETYIQLYADTLHPTYLRNIGRCYQNLGDADKAISSFREYLRQAQDLAPKQRETVEGYLREMEELKRTTERERASPPAPSVAPTTRAPPAPRLPPVVVSPRPAEPPAVEPGSARRTATYLVAGASAVALGAGAVFGLRALSRNNEAGRLCPKDQCSPAGYTADQQARTAAHVADVAVGLGLAGAAVATYLFLSAGDPAPPPHQTALRLRLLPQVAAGQAGVVLGGVW